MNQFPLIFKHYFKRSLIEPLGIIMLIIFPIIIILINLAVVTGFQDAVYVNGYNLTASSISIIIVVFFQFFGGSYIAAYIKEDIKGAISWRLFSAPVRSNTFVLAAAAASWLISLVQGLFVVVFVVLFLNVSWGSIPVLLLTLAALSAISQCMYLLCTILPKKKGTASALPQLISWAMILASGNMINFGSNAVLDFLGSIPSPIVLGNRALWGAGIVGEIAGYTMSDSISALWGVCITLAVLLAASVIAGRSKKLW